MSAIAAFTIADGKTTPVNHTFSPVNIDSGGIAKWADRSIGIALGYNTFSLLLRQPSKTARNHKVTMKLELPVLEVTSASTASGIQPAPTKAFGLFANVELILPDRATAEQCNHLLTLLKNALAQTFVKAAVETKESVY